jgi:tetratricopeptide (TPR) repeat protein
LYTQWESYRRTVAALVEALTQSPTELVDLDGSGVSYAEFVPQLAEARLHLRFAPLDKASAVELAAVVGRDPKNAKAHFLLGRTLVRWGDRTDARAAFETAARLEPNNQMYREAVQYIEGVASGARRPLRRGGARGGE